MDKSNLELFKQAVSEGLSNKFDSVANQCTEEIVYSERHKLAMRTIIYGKTDTKRVWSPKMKRIVAILIVAALLLTSCGIIFRNEIREVFEEFFVKLSYDGDDEAIDLIEEVYYLSYIPEGYVLKRESTTAMRVQYKFENQGGDFINYEQHLMTSSSYYIDNENGYSQINEIENYDVYYRLADNCHWFIWHDETYSIQLRSSSRLSNEEIVRIIEGIKTK